jgi:hypothetical protein
MLGTILVTADRCGEAIPVFNDILSRRGPDLPDTDPSVGYALVYRGYCRAMRGETRAGAADARAGLALCHSLFGPSHYIVHLAESLTGAALGVGPATDRADAARLLDAGVAGLRRTLSASHPRTRDAERRQAAFRAATRTRQRPAM